MIVYYTHFNSLNFEGVRPTEWTVNSKERSVFPHRIGFVIWEVMQQLGFKDVLG